MREEVLQRILTKYSFREIDKSPRQMNIVRRNKRSIRNIILIRKVFKHNEHSNIRYMFQYVL